LQEPSQERYSILFKIAHLSELISNSNSNSNSSNSNSDDKSNSDSNRVSEGYVRFRQLKRVADLLIATNQIPPEKSVAETGVEYPFVTYRLKNSGDIANLYYTNAKKVAPKDDEVVSRGDFELFLKSSQCCVWGDCFALLRQEQLESKRKEEGNK
jgi:hypothetical protein